MVSKTIRKRVYKLIGDAFLAYQKNADPQKLRIADGYFHVLTEDLAEHLWAVHPHALDIFSSKDEWMEHIGETFSTCTVESVPVIKSPYFRSF